jgi:mannose/fructose-specific phosphotransferase system component IIA
MQDFSLLQEDTVIFFSDFFGGSKPEKESA